MNLVVLRLNFLIGRRVVDRLYLGDSSRRRFDSDANLSFNAETRPEILQARQGLYHKVIENRMLRILMQVFLNNAA